MGLWHFSIGGVWSTSLTCQMLCLCSSDRVMVWPLRFITNENTTTSHLLEILAFVTRIISIQCIRYRHSPDLLLEQRKFYKDITLISRTNRRSWGFISQSNFNPLYNHLISLVWYWMVFNIRKLRTKMERKETEEVPSKWSLCIGPDRITWYFIRSWLFVLRIFS